MFVPGSVIVWIPFEIYWAITSYMEVVEPTQTHENYSSQHRHILQVVNTMRYCFLPVWRFQQVLHNFGYPCWSSSSCISQTLEILNFSGNLKMFSVPSSKTSGCFFSSSEFWLFQAIPTRAKRSWWVSSVLLLVRNSCLLITIPSAITAIILAPWRPFALSPGWIWREGLS